MKYIHTLLLALAFSMTINAQLSDERRERMESRIESQKVAYITQKLDLTPSEAQKFWPIYNEYQDKMKESRTDNKQNWKSDSMNEEEADAFIAQLLNSEQKELDLKKQYLNRLKTVIPTKKVANLYIIEKRFRAEMLEKIKNKIGKKMKRGRRNDSF